MVVRVAVIRQLNDLRILRMGFSFIFSCKFLTLSIYLIKYNIGLFFSRVFCYIRKARSKLMSTITE
jgi:hypothetical protein